MFKKFGIAVFFAAMFGSHAARAGSVQYSYVGQTYTLFSVRGIGYVGPPALAPYSSASKVTGNFVVSSALENNIGVFDYISFSFSDGSQTITSDTAEISTSNLFVETDALGNITDWNIQVAIVDPYSGQISTTKTQDSSVVFGGGGSGSVNESGSWTRQGLGAASSPEPQTLVQMLGAALACGIGTRIRSRRQA